MKISQLFGVLYHGTARNNLAFHPHHPAYLTSDVDEARNYASMDAEVDGGTPIVLTLKIAHPMPAFLPFMLLQDIHLPQHEGLCASLRSEERRAGKAWVGTWRSRWWPDQ